MAGTLIENQARLDRPIRAGPVHPQEKKYRRGSDDILFVADKPANSCLVEKSGLDMISQQVLALKKFFHVLGAACKKWRLS